MKLSRIWKLLPLLLAVLLCCNGCWDKKEFNQLAIAQTIAIDYEKEQYHVTVQLVMPAASDEEISGDSMWLIDGTGDSVAKAMEQISYMAPRALYLEQLDIVLLGEGLLQHNVGQGLEYLIKEQVLRRRTNLLAVKGSAGEVLQAKRKLADVDIYYLRNLLRDQRRWVKHGDATINDYYLAMDSDLSEGLVISQIVAKDEKVLELNGAALVQNHQLVCWLDQSWMNSYRWITGGARIYTLPANAYHDAVTVEVRKKQCKWELLSKEPLKVRANLYGTLRIVENTVRTEQRTLEEEEGLYRQVQLELEQILMEQAEQGFAHLQQYGCDALQLGQWLQAWHPKLIQRDNWSKQFSALPIDVQLHTDIKSYE